LRFFKAPLNGTLQPTCITREQYIPLPYFVSGSNGIIAFWCESFVSANHRLKKKYSNSDQKNTEPEAEGTLISNQQMDFNNPVKGISHIDK
jgi:hypothetical protein